jgi:hypothetical protein
VIDARAGCGTPPYSPFCAIRVTVNGDVEYERDFLTFWSVADPLDPLASATLVHTTTGYWYNQVFYLNTISSGVFLVRFTSDGATNSEGWTLDWSASPGDSTGEQATSQHCLPTPHQFFLVPSVLSRHTIHHVW